MPACERLDDRAGVHYLPWRFTVTRAAATRWRLSPCSGELNRRGLSFPLGTSKEGTRGHSRQKEG